MTDFLRKFSCLQFSICMKKYVFLILLLFSGNLYSQGVFFKMGKNYSSFSYKNNTPFADKIKINGTGSSYELGYTMPLKFKDFSIHENFFVFLQLPHNLKTIRFTKV